MFPNLPQLKVLSLESLLLHEDHDRRRTGGLVEKLRQQGILRNPPIVMSIDHVERYVVLDGANRVTALQEMEFPHIVAQVVHPDDPKVRLKTWNHVIWGMEAAGLLSCLGGADGIDLTPLAPGSTGILDPDCLPVRIHLGDGRGFLACATSDPVQQVAGLHAIVNSYKDRARFDRTDEKEIDFFKSVHPDLAGLVVFPHFEIRTVLDLADRGHVFPTGITRFSVSPRALHLNYPLEALAGPEPRGKKQADLEAWIQARIQKGNVRHYVEETVLFDE